MDGIDQIVEALRAGALAGATATASTAVKDAYGALTKLIRKRFDQKQKHEQGKLILDNFERNPEAHKAVMAEALRDVGVDEAITTKTELLKRLLAKQNGISVKTTGESTGSVTAGVVMGDVKVEHGSGQGREAGGNGGKGNGWNSGGEGQDFGLPDGLTLLENEADCMLWMAVKPELKYPVCHHRAVTHASGAAVASIVTKAIAREISFLINRFRNCGRQLARCESEPCVERVDEYALELAGLKQDLERLARRTCPEGSKGGMLIGETFAKLDGGNKILCGEILDVILRSHDLLEELESLKMQMPDEDSGDCGDEIRGKFVDKGVAIEELGDKLSNVAEDILGFEGRVKLDWDKDQYVIWGPRCRPWPEEYRECTCED